MIGIVLTEKGKTMNDLISRQEAIDLFPNDALEWDTNCGYIAPHFARRMIEELPSAQPEIIRCKERRMRLIDADDLKDWAEIVQLTDDGGIDINDFEEKLKSMPTVDAEPVRHGHWICSDNLYETAICSVCGSDSYITYNFAQIECDYCTKCGAKMDGERKEE